VPGYGRGPASLTRNIIGQSYYVDGDLVSSRMVAVMVSAARIFGTSPVPSRFHCSRRNLLTRRAREAGATAIPGAYEAYEAARGKLRSLGLASGAERSGEDD
jgi:hypothetical protein